MISCARSGERAMLVTKLPASFAVLGPIAAVVRTARRGLPVGRSSEPGGFDRLLARVVVEPLAGLAPVPARGEHLAQGRRLGEAPLAELVEHHLADGAHRVEADEVGERQRPHRVPGAGLHRLVDLRDRADALLVGADRVEYV